jgi:hypothetical protein
MRHVEVLCFHGLLLLRYLTGIPMGLDYAEDAFEEVGKEDGVVAEGLRVKEGFGGVGELVGFRLVMRTWL